MRIGDMKPKTRMRIFVAIGLCILCFFFFRLLVLGQQTEGWGKGDTIAVWLGVIVAIAQVLLIYSLIDPLVDAITKTELNQDWKLAMREFLALCSMSARDLSRSLAYNIEESNNGTDVIVLRHGIAEALEGIPAHSLAFDSMTRLCSSAFSDNELANLSQISAELKSCALNASSASRRLEFIRKEIPLFTYLEEGEVSDHTFHRNDISEHKSGPNRERVWLVRDIDELFEPMIEACTKLKEFVAENDRAKPDYVDFVEESLRYRRAINKQKDMLDHIERKKGERPKIDLREDARAAKHMELLEISIQQLTRYNKRVHEKGICIAWVPEETTEPDFEADEQYLRA